MAKGSQESFTIDRSDNKDIDVEQSSDFIKISNTFFIITVSVRLVDHFNRCYLVRYLVLTKYLELSLDVVSWVKIKTEPHCSFFNTELSIRPGTNVRSPQFVK